MSRMKTFFRYLFIFLFIYFFVSIMTYLNVKALTSDLKVNSNNIEFSNPEITIEEAKTSKVNATVRGKMKVDENQPVGYKYIRADFLSERGNILNTKYIELEDLKPGEEKEFDLNTNTENVKDIKFTLTDLRNVGKIKSNIKDYSDLIFELVLIYTLLF